MRESTFLLPSPFFKFFGCYSLIFDLIILLFRAMFSHILHILSMGGVKVERSPPKGDVVSSNHSRFVQKIWKMSAKFESYIDKPER